VSPGSETGILYEYRRIGASVKVTAIDPKTGREVSIVGPASACERALADAAAKKLRYVQERQAAQASTSLKRRS
jgi:hypothetical protein